MRQFEERLGPGSVYVCAECSTHLSRVECLESKQFKGKTGPAYLIERCWNIRRGPAEDRHLLTGEHTIQEIFCQKCHQNVGWTYLRAYEHSQQYKVGKFILEKNLIRKKKIVQEAPHMKPKHSIKKPKRRLSVDQ